MEFIAEWIPQGFSPDLAGQLAGMNREGLVSWANLNAKFLRPNEQNQLQFDDDLRALNVAFDQAEFLDIVTRELRGAPEEQARGHRLAGRYLPDMPTDRPDAAAAWIKENRGYLFASDAGDYRWYIDPLAKRRGVGTKELRGPLRADTMYLR
jgi:hypothetical protein